MENIQKVSMDKIWAILFTIDLNKKNLTQTNSKLNMKNGSVEICLKKRKFKIKEI